MTLLQIGAKVKISDGAIVFQNHKVGVWKNTDDPTFFTIEDIPPGSERILLRPSSQNDPIYVRPQDIFEYTETIRRAYNHGNFTYNSNSICNTDTVCVNNKME